MELRDRARYWGWAIGASYSEPFLTREVVVALHNTRLL